MALIMAMATPAFAMLGAQKAPGADFVIASAPLIIAPDNNGHDWTGTRYEQAVSDLMVEGIINGDTDGQFHGESTLTRAQFCKMVALVMAGTSADFSKYEATAKTTFGDLGGAGWAAGYIGYAVEKGIVNGYGNGKFGPSDNVTLPQLSTMVVRAAGLATTADGVENGLSLAIDNFFFHDMGLVADPGSGLMGMANLNIDAEKWMAAMMVNNAKEKIAAYASEQAKKEPAPVQPSGQETVNGMTFVQNGTFSDDMKTYNKVAIADGVKIYSFGERSDYTKDMKLGEFGKMNVETIYKYRNTTTPVWYATNAKGQISTIVLPGNVGFSGRALGAINARSSMVNGAGDNVAAFESLIGGHEIVWLAKKSTAEGDLVSDVNLLTGIKAGTIFEIKLNGGQVTGIKTGETATGFVAERTVDSLSVGAWREVTKVNSNAVLKVSGAAIQNIELADNAAVYILNEDEDGYDIGSYTDISEGDFVRIYDVYDNDKSDAGNIVFVKPER